MAQISKECGKGNRAVISLDTSFFEITLGYGEIISNTHSARILLENWYDPLVQENFIRNLLYNDCVIGRDEAGNMTIYDDEFYGITLTIDDLTQLFFDVDCSLA